MYSMRSSLPIIRENIWPCKQFAAGLIGKKWSSCVNNLFSNIKHFTGNVSRIRKLPTEFVSESDHEEIWRLYLSCDRLVRQYPMNERDWIALWCDKNTCAHRTIGVKTARGRDRLFTSIITSAPSSEPYIGSLLLVGSASDPQSWLVRIIPVMIEVGLARLVGWSCFFIQSSLPLAFLCVSSTAGMDILKLGFNWE